MSKLFISYVREDSAFVEYFCECLKKNRVEYFLDVQDLSVGMRWKDVIEKHIRNGQYFVCVFSKNRAAREVSYAHEELVIAVEELRKRASDRRWFLPVRIDDCEIENRSIGGGERLSDLHFQDFRNWPKAMRDFLMSIGVNDPIVHPREPLCMGIGPFVRFNHGFVVYDRLNVPPAWQGLQFSVTGGWCLRRADGVVEVKISLQAPTSALQTAHEAIGYGQFHVFSNEKYISNSPHAPSIFKYSRVLTVPAGVSFPDFGNGGYVQLPFPLELATEFIARGWISDGKFIGTFDASVVHEGLQLRDESFGRFEISFVDADMHPPY